MSNRRDALIMMSLLACQLEYIKDESELTKEDVENIDKIREALEKITEPESIKKKEQMSEKYIIEYLFSGDTDMYKHIKEQLNNEYGVVAIPGGANVDNFLKIMDNRFKDTSFNFESRPLEDRFIMDDEKPLKWIKSSMSKIISNEMDNIKQSYIYPGKWHINTKNYFDDFTKEMTFNCSDSISIKSTSQKESNDLLNSIDQQLMNNEDYIKNNIILSGGIREVRMDFLKKCKNKTITLKLK